MVVLVFVNDEGNLGSPTRAAQFKGAREKPLGIVAHQSGYHVRASLRISVVERGISANGARLVERCVTFGVFSTSRNLFGVYHIHCIAEAIVGEANSTSQVPEIRVV